MKLTVISNKTSVIECAPGETLACALSRSGYDISLPCGGAGVCGKCKMRVVFPNGDARMVSACSFVPESNLSVILPKLSDIGAERYDTGNLSGNRFDIALDLGTTTLAYYLINNKTVVAELSRPNPQRSFGADVMSRIHRSRKDFDALYRCLFAEINRTISELGAKYAFKSIDRLYITGNTVMLHIASKTDPTPLGQYPYTPGFLNEKTIDGKELGLNAKTVVFSPAFSSFIGGDAVSASLSVDLDVGEMLVDIGTNCEIVLRDKDAYLVASAPSGPAMEGANIECGMTFGAGAIYSASVTNGEMSCQSVGNEPPVGICGSGLVDCIAAMLELGVIDQSGAMLKGDKYFVSESVYISQRDVRQFQLAAAALRTATDITASLSSVNINRIYLAGAFGSSLDIRSVLTDGILGKGLGAEIITVGNAAGKGAVMCLTDNEIRQKAGRIALLSKPIELVGNAEFDSAFLKNLNFPS